MCRSRGDDVAEPPAGHREELREAVEDEGIVGELEGGMLRVSVDEAVIDLVRDHGNAEAADLGEVVLRDQRAGGIRGGVDDDGARPGTDRRAHGVRLELEAFLFPARMQRGTPLRYRDEIRIAGVARIRR